MVTSNPVFVIVGDILFPIADHSTLSAIRPTISLSRIGGRVGLAVERLKRGWGIESTIGSDRARTRERGKEPGRDKGREEGIHDPYLLHSFQSRRE